MCATKNAGIRVNNYIRGRIVNAALGLEEGKPDAQWLQEAVDEATDEDLVHVICEYLDSRPERKVGLAPSGNGVEARVGETQWDDSGHYGHASFRVVGWDFVSLDFKDQLRLDREYGIGTLPSTSTPFDGKQACQFILELNKARRARDGQ